MAVNITTIKPAGGGDFANAQAWEDWADGQANDHQRGECYTGGDLGIVYFAGWTASAAEHPELWAAAGEANNGVAGVGCYINNGNGQRGITCAASDTLFLHVKGIRLVRTHVTAGIMCYVINKAVKGFQIEACLFDNRATACGVGQLYLEGYITNSATYDCAVWNNVWLGGGNGRCADFYLYTLAVVTPTMNVAFYNNTVTEGSFGIYARESSGGGGTATMNLTLRNNLSLGNGTDYARAGIVNGVVTSDHNADSDNTLVALGWNGAGTLSNQVPGDIFTDYPGDDLSLKAGSNAIDAGTDLSGVGIVDDIAGLARPSGAAYDMGAFERLALGGAYYYRETVLNRRLR